MKPDLEIKGINESVNNDKIAKLVNIIRFGNSV